MKRTAKVLFIVVSILAAASLVAGCVVRTHPVPPPRAVVVAQPAPPPPRAVYVAPPPPPPQPVYVQPAPPAPPPPRVY